MSYPFIFKKDDRWYMIPETNQAKQLILYAADDFPFRWKRYKALLDGKECVDTNVVDIDSTLFLITYEKGTPNKLVIYKIENGFNLKKQNEIKDSDNQRRGAGQIVIDGGSFIRPSQNCKNRYGESVVFNRIPGDLTGDYHEEKTGELKIEDISVAGIKQTSILGVHTVSYSNDYQFIDYFYKSIKFRNIFSKKFLIRCKKHLKIK